MTAIDQFVAHVGLDWTDKKHDVIRTARTRKISSISDPGSGIQMDKDCLPLLEDQNPL